MIQMPAEWRLLGRLKGLKRKGFAPKVSLQMEVGSFRIKTVSSSEELDRVLKLRYQIFHREYRGAWLPRGLDIDRFDFECDHLIIQDLSQDERLVGTYRLLSSKFNDSFYSSDEFDLSGFLAAPGVKLELGRACVDREYRGGVVMTLLWRGLVAYLKEVGAEYLFGCSSIKTVDPFEAARLSAYLAKGGHVLQDYGIRPTAKYRFSQWPSADVGGDEMKELIPSLLSAYLRAGAQVAGEPAYDRDFRCVDFLTILKTDRLTENYERKYQARK